MRLRRLKSIAHRVKAEPSDNIASPASVSPMVETSMEYSPSTPGSNGAAKSFQSDPIPTPFQYMASITRSEAIPRAKPAADVDEDVHDASMNTDPQQWLNETDYLQQLVYQPVPEVLEAGVNTAIKLLDQLKEPLEKCPSQDVDAWLKTINDLKSRAKPLRTVIGVVGNTGAGKSSIINAVLDEERLEYLLKYPST